MSFPFIFYQIHSFSFKYALLRDQKKNEDISSMLKIIHKALFFVHTRTPCWKSSWILILNVLSSLKRGKIPAFRTVTISQSKSNNVLLSGRIGTKIFCQILDCEFFFLKYGHHENLLKIQFLLIAIYKRNSTREPLCGH